MTCESILGCCVEATAVVVLRTRRSDVLVFTKVMCEPHASHLEYELFELRTPFLLRTYRRYP